MNEKRMSAFFVLNRMKLRFAFRVCSFTFITLVLVILGIAWYNGAAPSIGLVVIILVTAGIVFPVFILFLGWMGWLNNNTKRKRAFSAAPFDELARIGFYKVRVNENSKWVFTEEAWEGKINGFTIECDMVRDQHHLIEMGALCARRQIEAPVFAALTQKFKQYDIEFGFGSLIKKYDTKRMTIQTIQELKSDLEYFTSLLKQEGFEAVDVKGI